MTEDENERGRIIKELRGQGVEGSGACIMKSLKMNSGTQMENDSGEEKHEEMQVSGLLSVMTATRSSHTSGSAIVGEAHRPASMGERWFQLEQEGKEPLEGG